jgi:DNA-nicking Smr family endonuclease
MDIDARLDLHGMTREAAHPALTRFLAQGAVANYRCVLVITGKGTPRELDADTGFMPDRSLGVLRAEVPRWLSDSRQHVVAWATAIPRDGGDGALYVLLRRTR